MICPSGLMKGLFFCKHHYIFCNPVTFVAGRSPKMDFKLLLTQNFFQMSLHDKYKAVLELGQEFQVKDGYVKEEDGKLKIGGMTQTQYHKDKMWDAIKEANMGAMPTDLSADIKVEATDYYHKHIVEKGESLSKIAKHYYKDPMKYMMIFNANTSILKDPDMIQPGQELVIPFDN